MRRAVILASSAVLGVCVFLWLRRRAAPRRPPLGYLHIYVGTETGHSLSLARRLSAEALHFNFTPRLIPLEEFQPLDFRKHDYCVIICSTTAGGQPPENARSFLKWLTKSAQARSEDLRGLSFCVFGLSKSVEHGCFCAEQIEQHLEALSATRLVRRGSGTEGSVQSFGQWAQELWQVLPGVARHSRRTCHVAHLDLLEVAYQVPLDSDPGPTQIADNGFLHSQTFEVGMIQDLQKDPEASTLHVQLRGKGPFGGLVAVFPQNDEDLVHELAGFQGYKLEDTFMFISEPGTKHPFPTPTTVLEALTRYCDLTSMVSKRTLKMLSAFASDPEEAEQLRFLASVKGKEELRRLIYEPMLNVNQVLELFKSVRVPIGALVQVLDRIQPRVYVLSSGSKSSTLDFAISVLKTRNCEGLTRTGLCSRYFHKMYVTGLFKSVRGFVFSGKFKIPSQQVPLIVIASDGGISLVRAIVRELSGSSDKRELYVFLSSKEFLYKRDIEEAIVCGSEEPLLKYQHRPAHSQSTNVITKAFVAFSKALQKEVHISDVVSSESERVWNALEAGGHVFACGPKPVLHGLTDLLNSIVADHIGEKSDNYIANLVQKKRLIIELWD